MELARECNVLGERAARAYLDGDLEPALAAADRAVAAAGTLHREDTGDHEVADVFAERLRTRAEIRLVLASVQRDRAEELVACGIDDATRSIALIEELKGKPAARFPLRTADLRLLLGDLHAAAGNLDLALRSAVSSIEDHRRSHRAGDESGDLSLARALCRYADLLDTVGADQAVTVRRESVALYRPYARPGAHLWTVRFSRGTTWLSTPTLERFCQTAYRLASSLGPPSIRWAAEAMLALQDAAEGFAGLLPDATPAAVLMFADPAYLARLADVSGVLREQADWSRGISAPWLVRAYEEAERLVTTRPLGENLYDLVSEIRAPLEETLARLSGRGRPGPGRPSPGR
jgi:hypothetical protein